MGIQFVQSSRRRGDALQVNAFCARPRDHQHKVGRLNFQARTYNSIHNKHDDTHSSAFRALGLERYVNGLREGVIKSN